VLVAVSFQFFIIVFLFYLQTFARKPSSPKKGLENRESFSLKDKSGEKDFFLHLTLPSAWSSINRKGIAQSGQGCLAEYSLSKL
jgi:hypothetical protein